MNALKSGIICPNQIISHENDFVLLVYCAIQTILRFNQGIKLIVPINIAYVLGIPINPIQHKKKKEIIDALDDLCDLGFAQKYNDNKDFYLINTDIFYNQKKGFEKIDFKIFEKVKHDAGLLKHYILIKKGRIDGKCTYSEEYFIKAESVSYRTIVRRNKELLDLELIYIYRPSVDLKNNKYPRNIYMLFDHSKVFEKKENYSNLNRSISQRYNSFVKNPDKFTPLMRKTLRKQVEEYNARNPDRAKDLTVFDTEIN